MIDAEADPVVATEERLVARSAGRALTATRRETGPAARTGVLAALPSRPPSLAAGELAVPDAGGRGSERADVRSAPETGRILTLAGLALVVFLLFLLRRLMQAGGGGGRS